MNGANLSSTEHFKRIRAAILPNRRHEASNSALDLFSQMTDITLSFAPFGTEINLWPLNHLLMEQGFLALPKVVGDYLVVYQVTKQSQLIPSKWGIQEPDPEQCHRLPKEKIRHVLVPGLAFDRDHHRKGYGFGYYDRFLATAPNIKSIGVGFKEQFSEELLEIHDADVPLNELMLF